MSARLHHGRLPALRRAAAAVLAALLAGTLAQASASAAPALAAPSPGVSTPAAKKIDRRVSDALATSPETSFLVQLGGKAAVPTAQAGQPRAQRTKAVFDAKRQFADKSQAGVRQFLSARKASFTPYWIANVVQVTGDGALVEELARRSDVAKILPNSTYAIPQPPKGVKPLAEVDAVEWNIANVRANEVWEDFGVTGDGIVIANIDTGVDFRHPTLVDTYRGNNGNGQFEHDYNWFDPSNVCGTPSVEPCDNAGHGTHTMGTMVGDDKRANQIGVAPGATWIAAKGCEDWWCSDAALLASGQWIVAPTDLRGRNPRPDLAPDIVNNSWGGGPDNPFYAEIVDTWVAAGIFPAFSIGNSGAGCNSASSPGDYPQSYGTGAYDYYGNIAYFSSRGPGQGDDLKPNISAPGVAVRSAVPGNEYQSWDGTSMASPHVAAAVALAWSAAPALIGDVAATRQLLDDTAVDVLDNQCGGTSDPDNADNNVYGEGRLDAYALVEASPRGPSGALTGSVTSGGAPLAGATVRIVGEEQQTTRRTDDLGRFRAPHLAVGEYTVTISKFAYLTQTATVTITEGQTTTLNVDLVPAPRSSLRGTVRQEDGSPVAFATVTIDGTPILPIATAWDGSYVFPFVAHGEYDVTVDFGKWLQPVTKHVVINADTTLDFVLPPKTDSFGYSVQPTWPQYVDAQTVLPLTGDDSLSRVELPFAFPFYGTSYRQATISTNGYLSFSDDEYWSSYWNSSIPSGGEPNNAIYALWDDLVVDDQSSVRTQTLGAAPNRQFVIEWRNVLVRLSSSNARVTVQVVLDELGRVTVQYKDLDSLDLWESGASATVGIENANGTIGLEYSYNQISLHDAVAVQFGIPDGGILRGVVTDSNDGDPVAGATVRATRGDFSRETTTDTGGFYQLQLPAGEYTLTVSSGGYVTAEVPVTIPAYTVVTRDLVLDAPRLTVAPEDGLELVVPAGQQRTRALTLGNTGSAPAHWEMKEVQGGTLAAGAVANARAAAKKAVAALPGGKADPKRTTTAGLDRAAPAAVPPGTMAAGDVLKSWPVGNQRGGYGVGYDGSVWVSNQVTRVNEKYTVDGVFQRQLPATHGDWMGDMAFVPGKDAMCQTTVGGDNAVRCWNRDNGASVATITGPWAAAPQPALAYRADDDSFYIGGSWEGIIYHVAGLSDEQPGRILSQCASPHYGIAGLAWSPRGVLWQTSNGDPEPIYGLNPDTCAIVQTMPDPDPLSYTGAGVELDEGGNLWIVSQNPWGGPSTARLVETPVPTYSDVPWLSAAPASGTLPAGQEQRVDVTIDTTGLAPGVYGATILVNSDSPRRPVIGVPVKLVVPRYQTSIDAGATAGRVDGTGDTWRADTPWVAGDAGYLGTSTVVTSPQPVTGTPDPWLYETAREGAYEYRFDAVPNGTYQVDLDFAEIGGAEPNTRVFDVTLERTLVMPGFDIVNETPPFGAKRETFTVVVTDGQLNVRLLARTGLPLINGVRVTERPDLAG